MQFKTFDIVPHGTKFDFVGKRKIALILSTLFNLSVILWALPQIHGLDYGVDFAGGTEMQVRFDKTVDPGEVRKNIVITHQSLPSLVDQGRPAANDGQSG